MPAVIHKIDFSAAERSGDFAFLNPADCKVIPFAPEIKALASYRSPCAIPRQHPQAIAAALSALILHVAGLMLLPGTAPKDIVTPPKPIQVSWLAEPQAKAPAPPKQQAPTIKPKLKPKPKAQPVKRVQSKPKALLSTHVPAPAIASAPPETAQARVKPAEAPAAKLTPSVAPAAAGQQPLTLPNLNADYLNNPAPRYPEAARELGEQGKVLVRALINTDGTVAQLALRRSSGHASLDRSALDTVKQWRFVPARRGSSAVAAWVVVPITFSLEG